LLPDARFAVNRRFKTQILLQPLLDRLRVLLVQICLARPTVGLERGPQQACEVNVVELVVQGPELGQPPGRLVELDYFLLFVLV
jgi:hypothetical protein